MRNLTFSSLAALVAAGALLAAGCGTNDVAVSVDVLSFVDEEERGASYAAPPGVRVPPATIEPQSILLVEGLADGMNMVEVELSFRIDFTGEPATGSGNAEVELYLADPDAGDGGSAVYQTTPIYSGSLAVSGGQTARLEDTITASEVNGLLPLFQSGRLVFGLALAFDATGSSETVVGQWQIQTIDALIMGRGDIF
jgi:hypothetical protein